MNPHSLIPSPQNIKQNPDYFTLRSDTNIITNEPDRANAQYLQKRLSYATGYTLYVTQELVTPGIQLVLKESLKGFGIEGYTLEVTKNLVTVASSTPHGIFNGLQTLLQLLPPEIDSTVPLSKVEWIIPGVCIQDRPRFSWRGFMLDEGRHFHGKDTVLFLLDVMASLKMNIFHWHLTEDQGWRLPIQQYPRLMAVGSQRVGTSRSLMDMIWNRHDGQPHTGFYTRDQICEVLAYAAERHITVIPEIEMPGHSMAALAAYPENSCTGGPFEVPTRFGIYNDIYCPGKESTFTFLQNILDEVIDLFPAQYIHIGGDEVPKVRWRRCPDCQRRVLDQGLAGEHALQTYFTNRIANYIFSHGRTMIAWNQALNSDLHPDAVIQYWFGNRKVAVDAVRAGRRMVISSFLDTYLDHSYLLTPLSRIYHFEPVFDGLRGSYSENILGVEAPLWTEYVPDRARLDFQTFPRLLAVAETGWTAKQNKDLVDFKARLKKIESRLGYRGIRFGHGKDVEPPWFKRLFGLFTILQPQRKIADRVH